MGEPKTETTSASTIRDAAGELQDVSAETIMENIGAGGTATPFDEITELPEMFTQAFEQLQSQLGEGTGQFVRESLQSLIAGEGTFQADEAGIAQRFNQNITTPLTEAVQQTLGQSVFNQVNTGSQGGFFASNTGAKVGSAVGAQVTQIAAPLLSGEIGAERGRAFQSAETLRAMTPGLLGALQAQPFTEFGQIAQASLGFQAAQEATRQAQQQEFLRKFGLEADPFLQAAMGFNFSPTVQNDFSRSPDRFGQFLELAGTAAGGFLGGPAGAALGSQLFGSGGGGTGGGTGGQPATGTHIF